MGFWFIPPTAGFGQKPNRALVFCKCPGARGGAQPLGHDGRAAQADPNPTWRIGPAFQLFSRHKLLIFRGGVPRKVSKPAVVKTPPVPKSAPMCIIDSCYVPALHDAKEKRQRAPLLQFSREPSGERRASGSTARVLSGRDQRPPARSLAQNH